MIRSLRLRIFLITWPLSVLAVAGVAYTFARWTSVRLTSIQLTGPDPTRAAFRARVDSATRAWVEGEIDDSALASRLRGIASADSVAGVIVNPHGRIVVSTDSNIALHARVDSLPNSGLLAFERTIRNGRTVAVDLVDINGRPIVDATGQTRGATYLIPPPRARAAVSTGALRADARRTLWIAVVGASALAAVLALVLASPLVGQVSTTLERAESIKRNLVHDVAHELRTPLTNIVGIVEAIQDGMRSADESTLALLHAEAGLLTALVSDLQDLSLAESGQLAFDLEAVDVSAECNAAVDAMRGAAKDVSVFGPAPAPVFALADARRLRQVLRNLLANAITHTPSGGVIRVMVETRSNQVGVSVSDTGRGIPPEHLSLVWERFHRVDPSRDRERGGRGLGLAIVKQFVERMNGRVAATSVEGQGSTFEIWLEANR